MSKLTKEQKQELREAYIDNDIDALNIRACLAEIDALESETRAAAEMEKLALYKLSFIPEYLNNIGELYPETLIAAVQQVEKAATWARQHIELRGQQNNELRAQLTAAKVERDQWQKLYDERNAEWVRVLSHYVTLDLPVYSPATIGEEIKRQLATAAERVKVLEEALRDVESIVEFGLQREINSPSNHQEFAREAADRLHRFRKTMATVSPLPAQPVDRRSYER